jgi:diadenosine tetraphosphate (Ap4A) HIT family hydrolase
METCIFCKIIKKEAPAYILDENEDIIVFLSHENHPLVVTKRHIQDISHGSLILKLPSKNWKFSSKNWKFSR